MGSSFLPVPDAASKAHSERCAAYIRARIQAAGGDISFAEYMQHALYAPGLGYYAAGTTKFGAAGDYITAPELSPVFSRIVATQCSELLRGIPQAAVLEFGAGSGKLAVELLRRLAASNALPEAYLILEVSPDLEARQRDRLQREVPELMPRIRWLSALPSSFRGVMLANEVLDAMPVERFVRRDQIRQVRVACDGEGFALHEIAANDPLRAAVLAVEADLGERLPDDYESEMGLAIPPWIAAAAASLAEGALLLFDYGSDRRTRYAADRHKGWLRCHFRHHAHDNPLILPGIQDITAWVDFSAVAGAALEAGLRVAGYTDQAHFLIGGGLERELASMSQLPTAEQLALSAQVKMLTLPGSMGERFKCMALVRGDIAAPSAFQQADRTHTL